MLTYCGLPVVHMLNQIFHPFLLTNSEQITVVQIFFYHSHNSHIQRRRVIFIFLDICLLLLIDHGFRLLQDAFQRIIDLFQVIIKEKFNNFFLVIFVTIYPR